MTSTGPEEETGSLGLFGAEAMADRKAELEKKRKKLDELRKARELKKAEAKDKEVVWPACMIVYTTVFMLSQPATLMCCMYYKLFHGSVATVILLDHMVRCVFVHKL